MLPQSAIQSSDKVSHIVVNFFFLAFNVYSLIKYYIYVRIFHVQTRMVDIITFSDELICSAFCKQNISVYYTSIFITDLTRQNFMRVKKKHMFGTIMLIDRLIMINSSIDSKRVSTYSLIISYIGNDTCMVKMLFNFI